MARLYKLFCLLKVWVLFWCKCLKEYYEIVEKSRPLSGFFSHTCWFFYGNAFLIMKLSNPSPTCFTIDVWNINCLFLTFLYIFVCISFYMSSVVSWQKRIKSVQFATKKPFKIYSFRFIPLYKTKICSLKNVKCWHFTKFAPWALQDFHSERHHRGRQILLFNLAMLKGGLTGP